MAVQSCGVQFLSSQALVTAASVIFDNNGITVRDRRTKPCAHPSGFALDQHGHVITSEETFDPPTSPLDKDGQGVPYAVYGFGAHMAEIEVDVELGSVRVLKSRLRTMWDARSIRR